MSAPCHHGTPRPLVLRLLHPSLSPPRPLTPLPLHKPCCRRHVDRLLFAGCATRARCLDSRHSNVTFCSLHRRAGLSPLSPCFCMCPTLDQPLTDSKSGQWAPLIIVLLQFVCSPLSRCPSPPQIVSHLVGVSGIAGRQASQLHTNGHNGASFHTAS